MRYVLSVTSVQEPSRGIGEIAVNIAPPLPGTDGGPRLTLLSQAAFRAACAKVVALDEARRGAGWEDPCGETYGAEIQFEDGEGGEVAVEMRLCGGGPGLAASLPQQLLRRVLSRLLRRVEDTEGQGRGEERGEERWEWIEPTGVEER